MKKKMKMKKKQENNNEENEEGLEKRTRPREEKARGVAKQIGNRNN